jgi:hypothetical protein
MLGRRCGERKLIGPIGSSGWQGGAAHVVHIRASLIDMAKSANRVNVVLDEEHAVKLRRLAERTRTNPGTIARSLLAAALDDADPDARTVTAILDRIDGAFEEAHRGLAEGRDGQGVRLEDM